MAAAQATSEPIPSNANAPKVKKVAASKKRDARKRPVKDARWWYKANKESEDSEDSEPGSVGDCWACGASLEFTGDGATGLWCPDCQMPN